jgi:hypothetical protein
MQDSAARSLWRAARIIRESADDLDVMIVELRELLEEAAPGVLQFKCSGYETDKDDKEDWITCSFLESYSVQKNQNRKGKWPKIGNVYFKTQLFSETEVRGNWSGREQAKLFAAFSGKDDYPWELGELCLDGDGKCENTRSEGRRWFWFEDEEEYEDIWFYCVPLDSLKDRESLKRIVVDPLVRLIKGKPDEDEEAFKGVNDTELCMPPDT